MLSDRKHGPKLFACLGIRRQIVRRNTWKQLTPCRIDINTWFQYECLSFRSFIVLTRIPKKQRRWIKYSAATRGPKATLPQNDIANIGVFNYNCLRLVTCEECGRRSTTFQHFQNLILDINQSDTVHDAMHNYFVGEQLSYVCGGCRKEVLAIKKFSIEKAPNVLCVQLKR